MGYFLSPFKHTNNGYVVGSNSDTAQDRRDYDLHARNGLVRTKGGFLDVPGRFCKAAWGNDRERKPTKLLLNVHLRNSFGPVHVLMSPENTVQDLKKAAVEAYVREKRRPLLACADPQRFVLHYSQFSLEGLMPEEKLNNLASRNFFLCQKPGNAFMTASNTADNSPFPSIKFMDFLL